MNELTKEDLECIKNAIELQLKTIPMSQINALCRRELLGKLDRLVDNYCEHKGEMIRDSAMIDICKECGRILND